MRRKSFSPNHAGIPATLEFEGKAIPVRLHGIPQKDDWIRHSQLDKELVVSRVIWTQTGPVLELSDPSGGHDWYQTESRFETQYECKTCGMVLLSEVPPGHENFPGTRSQKGSFIEKCADVVAASVHSA